MNISISSMLQSVSPSASIIISAALMLTAGFFMTRLTKLAKLPNVTAYILAGILLGPNCFSMVPRNIIDGMGFLADIALAFIAFGTGEFFRLDTLKKNGMKVVLITVAEALTASLAVFVLTFYILRLPLPFSIVLAALASATAPASTMMTIRQTGSKGDFVDTLLQVVALDDVVGLIAYSTAISVAVSSMTGEAINVMSIVKPLLINVGIMILGGLFGVLLKLMLPERRTTDNRLIVSIALLFAFCGVCAALDVSPLLGCMSMGTVYMNMSDDDRLFKQLNYFSPPILLLFFVRSGLNFRLEMLTDMESAISGIPLLLIGVLYFIVRILGKYAGAWLGCFAVKKDRLVRDYLGLALVPQAGVAIGLAALGARTLGGQTGAALETIILASSVLYELIGPACAKLSLYLSHSYSRDIEEAAPLEQSETEGRSEVELLIERIRMIQQEIPAHAKKEDEDEQAFTEAAEQFSVFQNARWHTRGRRR
ncbi:MAG: cation:proton antiporter [Firmicutes bacterium]|nr:cation:proton antiporter [Bacillota bacterium]